MACCLSRKPAPGVAGQDGAGQGRPRSRGREAIGGLHRRRGRAPVRPVNRLLRPLTAGSGKREQVATRGTAGGQKRGPAREARAVGDDGEATAQRGPSDSATECACLAAPPDSPDLSSGATGNGLSAGSRDAASDPAHRLLLC